MDHKDDNEDLVTFIPGSSVIDIAEIRRAQAQLDADLSDEEDLSLDDQAKLIMNELANDSELQKDVLAGFEETTSDEELAKIAEGVATQTAEDIAKYEQISMEVSSELRAENIDMIKEDILLESTIAQELAAEAKSETKAEKKKKGKKAKSEKTENTEDWGFGNTDIEFEVI
jgi:hypothetical protein